MRWGQGAGEETRLVASQYPLLSRRITTPSLSSRALLSPPLLLPPLLSRPLSFHTHLLRSELSLFAGGQSNATSCAAFPVTCALIASSVDAVGTVRLRIRRILS